ncbi:DUF86 domain-containing protein [Desulfofundulus salinus]|uniref:DUF86 domain-containing protein n=1 Tax=Desulfofundulus salinus TaxID=2419843 RepID=A0A494WWC2_9FIRM|nr:DUF86 domain-containing protein [Desulfofundulus salinum]
MTELTMEEFLADEQRVAASKYYLIVATEAAIDICNHLVARLTGRAPNSYAECFNILSGEHFLSPPLAERLIQMAKFRNLLIHRYVDIDDSKVYHIICNNLDDLELYLAEIAAMVKMRALTIRKEWFYAQSIFPAGKGTPTGLPAGRPPAG